MMQKWMKILISLQALTSTTVVQSAEKNLGFSKVRNLLSDEVYVHSTTPLTVYQFFASWCLGCSESMHMIEKYALPGKDANVSFRIVSIDEVRSSGVEYYNKKIKSKLEKVQAVLWDPTLSLADQLKFDTIPYVVLADATGKILWSRVGEVKEASALEFKKVLALHLEQVSTAEKIKIAEKESAKKADAPSPSAKPMSANSEKKSK